MRKKSIIVFLVLITVFMITGCGNTQYKATIITNSGSSENLTYSELMNIYKENEDKFDKEYVGADIEVTGTIKQIKKASITGYSGCYAGAKQIILEDGWIVAFDRDSDVDLSNLSNGDKIKVNSKIYGIEPFVPTIQSDFKEVEDYDVIFLTDSGNQKCHIGSSSKFEIINKKR